MRMLTCGLIVALLACAGCSENYRRTGDPGGTNHGARVVSRDNFDAVTAGMTRDQVIQYLGTPTNASLNVMHWEMGEFSDAWVVFDDSGAQVASKYWQDDGTLRLEDVPPVR